MGENDTTPSESAPAEEPHLLFEREGHTAIVTLNRPAKKNALSGEMLVRMYDAWIEIDQNPDIRVAIVTGAGGNFCSGADLKAMAAGHPDDEWTKRFNQDKDLHWKALLRHFIPSKPLIAAVEGNTFFVFAVVNACTFLFYLRFLPETRGHSLESLERHFEEKYS